MNRREHLRILWYPSIGDSRNTGFRDPDTIKGQGCQIDLLLCLFDKQFVLLCYVHKKTLAYVEHSKKLHDASLYTKKSKYSEEKYSSLNIRTGEHRKVHNFYSPGRKYFLTSLKYWLYLENLATQQGLNPAMFDGYSICTIGQSPHSFCTPHERTLLYSSTMALTRTEK